MPPDVFISHSKVDKSIADAICQKLESEGVRCWIAPRDIPPGAQWPSSLVTGVKTCPVTVLVFSKNADLSPHVQNEIAMAFHWRRTIIPFRLENVAPSGNLEYYLFTVQWIDAFAPLREHALERLVMCVRKLMPEREATTKASVSDALAADRGLFAQRYSAVFLGTFGGNQTIATGINDSDQVVGYSQFPNGVVQHAFLYQQGSLIDLNSDANEIGWAWGVNNHGQVVGHTANAQYTYAFRSQDSQITNLGTLCGHTGASHGLGINDLGDIVGASTIANGNYVPFLHRNGNMQRLGSISGTMSQALAINNRGQIVGLVSVATGKYRAFLAENGSLVDLGTLGGSQSQALGINNRGQIVGFSTLSNGQQHAFLYENGVMKDLGGGIRSHAQGVNDVGEIVGQSTDDRNSPTAFLWTTKTGLLDLNDYVINLSDGTSPGFTKLSEAHAINGRGNIAASGDYFDGSRTIQAACLLRVRGEEQKRTGIGR
jgi:probable HAF family extracellular repeat protein